GLSVWVEGSKLAAPTSSSGCGAGLSAALTSRFPSQTVNSPAHDRAVSHEMRLEAIGILHLHQQLVGIEHEAIVEIAPQVVIEDDEQVAEGAARPEHPRLGAEVAAFIGVLEEARDLQVGANVHLE